MSQELVAPPLSVDPRPERSVGGDRVLALDGIRGLAILMVMFFHFTMPLDGSTVVEKFILLVFYQGWAGVELFFVLSGYLITGLLWEALDQGEPGCLVKFYARRFLRIFPLYYGVTAILVLIVGVAAFWAKTNPKFLGLQGWVWLYAVNIGQALPVPIRFQFRWFDLTHFWTLAVEEHFYLLWPWLMLVRDRRRLILACFALFTISFGLRFIDGPAWFAPVTATPRQAGSLALGGGIALLLRGDRGARWLRKVALPVSITCGAAFVAMLLAGFDKYSRTSEIYSPLLLGLAFGGLIVQVTGPPGPIRRLFESPFLRFFGKYSYGLYVYHHLLFPVWLAIFATIYRSLGSYQIAALLVITIAFTSSVVLSLLSWRYFEKPILNLKRHFEYMGTERGQGTERGHSFRGLKGVTLK